jgi:hypothetical protein
MIYRPYVSWGVFGAATTAARAAYYVSWGLLGAGGAASLVWRSFPLDDFDVMNLQS